MSLVRLDHANPSRQLQPFRPEAAVLTPQHAANQQGRHQIVDRRRRLADCDPCNNADDRVVGDFNGDCRLLPSDASAIQAFTGVRDVFERSGEGIDPLDTYESSTGQSCQWLSQQGNPRRNTREHQGQSESLRNQWELLRNI